MFHRGARSESARPPKRRQAHRAHRQQPGARGQSTLERPFAAPRARPGPTWHRGAQRPVAPCRARALRHRHHRATGRLQREGSGSGRQRLWSRRSHNSSVLTPSDSALAIFVACRGQGNSTGSSMVSRSECHAFLALCSGRSRVPCVRCADRGTCLPNRAHRKAQRGEDQIDESTLLEAQ